MVKLEQNPDYSAKWMFPHFGLMLILAKSAKGAMTLHASQDTQQLSIRLF